MRKRSAWTEFRKGHERGRSRQREKGMANIRRNEKRRINEKKYEQKENASPGSIEQQKVQSVKKAIAFNWNYAVI